MAFIIKQKRADGRVDVHLAKSFHRPGQTPCHKRQHLGTLDLERNELILSKKLSEPADETLALLSKKGIRYNGRRRSNVTHRHGAPNKPCLDSSVGVEELGRVGVLGGLARHSGLAESLRETFGTDWGDRILRLAIHQVCEQGAVHLALDWWGNVGGIDVVGLSSSAAGQLLSSIGASPGLRRDFFAKWLQACDMPQALIHDTSSISTYSELLENAEWGYNRDGDKLPQINLALVVSRATRLPVWYRILPGSIPDVASLKATTTMLRDLGLSDFSFTLDRGYYSRANLIGMLDEGIRFTIGVPLHLKQAKELVRRHLAALTKFKRRFLANGIPVGHVPCRFDIERKDGTASLAAHLYYSKERQHQTTTRLERGILELAEKAGGIEFDCVKEARDWIAENAGGFAKYFRATTQDGRVIVKTKHNQVAAALKTHGLTLLVTSESGGLAESAAREAVLEDYRSRDLAEKLFDTYKNATGNARLRTGGNEAAEGRVFLAFVAMTLHALLENALRERSVKHKLCVPKALAMLRKVKRLVPVAGAPLLLEIPKKSRELLGALGFDAENLAGLRV